VKKKKHKRRGIKMEDVELLSPPRLALTKGSDMDIDTLESYFSETII
jgi:hypothetical protein